MYKWGKIIAFSLVMVLGSLIPAFSQSNPLDELQGSANEFVESIAKSLPFNSTLGLNWSDAYIGQLIGAPPHFGFGVSLGITTIDLGTVKKLMNKFGMSSIDLNKMPLPGYTADARLGGFVLPFDFGFKFGMLPGLGIGDDFKLDYMLLGGDIRYALLEGKGPLPKISVGFGINYLREGIRASIGSGTEFSFVTPDGQPPHTLKLEAADVGLSWSSTVFDLKAQVSKSFLIITPYLGLGGSFALSKIGYGVESSNLTYDGTGIDDKTLNEILDALKQAGIEGIDIDGYGFSSTYKTRGWGIRAFGGFSVNMLAVKLDLTGMFNFLDLNYGASLGIRFQL
ncbi:MAG: hypothetical protein LBT95_10185 [Treponema sp.]|jgi:hypothetical protein|nr:hypothetical protein [Treponema sp.]